MAKKKAAKRKPPARDKGKTRFEVRFDDDVADGLRNLADRAQVSVNQLLHGLARWAIQNPRLGDPRVNPDGSVHEQDSSEVQPGAIWWGKTAILRYLTGDEREERIRQIREIHGVDADPDDLTEIDSEGEVYLHLDFTERRVVRDDL